MLPHPHPVPRWMGEEYRRLVQGRGHTDRPSCCPGHWADSATQRDRCPLAEFWCCGSARVLPCQTQPSWCCWGSLLLSSRLHWTPPHPRPGLGAQAQPAYQALSPPGALLEPRGLTSPPSRPPFLCHLHPSLLQARQPAPPFGTKSALAFQLLVGLSE